MAKQPRRHRPIPPGKGVLIEPAESHRRSHDFDGPRGSILLPKHVRGYSALCNTIVEAAVADALEADLRPIERWAGWIPEVGRLEIFCAAANLDDELPIDDVIAAIREAMEFIGLPEGPTDRGRRQLNRGRPIDRAAAEPRPKPRRKRV